MWISLATPHEQLGGLSWLHDQALSVDLIIDIVKSAVKGVKKEWEEASALASKFDGCGKPAINNSQ